MANSTIARLFFRWPKRAVLVLRTNRQVKARSTACPLRSTACRVPTGANLPIPNTLTLSLTWSKLAVLPSVQRKKKEAGGGRLAQEGAARWREESVNVHPVGSVRSTRIRCPIRKRLATTFEKSVVRAPSISYYYYHSNRGCGRPRSSVWTFVSGTVCLAVRFIYSLIEL